MAWAYRDEIRLGLCTWYASAGELRRCVVTLSCYTWGRGAGVTSVGTQRETWIWSEEQADAEPLSFGRMSDRNLLHDLGIDWRRADAGLSQFAARLRQVFIPELGEMASSHAAELAAERGRTAEMFAALAGIEVDGSLTAEERESILAGKRRQ
jgi:hypothetical protein